MRWQVDVGWAVRSGVALMYSARGLASLRFGLTMPLKKIPKFSAQLQRCMNGTVFFRLRTNDLTLDV